MLEPNQVRGIDMLARSTVGALVTLLVISSMASAGQPQESDDAARYAEDVGVTYAEATRRLGMQEAAGQLEARLIEAAPDTFAGLWLVHDPRFGVVASFTTEPDAAVRSVIEDDPLGAVTVKARPAFSLRELERLAADILAEAGEGLRPFDLEVDVKAGVVVVYSTEAEAPAAMTRVVGPESPARHEQVDSLSVPTANIYGGLNIGCTSGFSVTNGATAGVTTAAHCGPLHTFQGVTLPVKAEKFTTSYDVQWNSAPGFTVKPWAYDGDSSPRTIVGSVSRSNTAIDTYLCKYGNATHFDCGYVVSKTYAPGWVPGAAATFMRLYNPGIDLASGTDSGGPIYSLTKAYGTTSGSFGSNNVDSNIYMASNYFTSGMGISLLAP